MFDITLEKPLFDDTIVFIFDTFCNCTFVETILGTLVDAIEDLGIFLIVVDIVWPDDVGANRIGPIGAKLANEPMFNVIPPLSEFEFDWKIYIYIFGCSSLIKIKNLLVRKV